MHHKIKSSIVLIVGILFLGVVFLSGNVSASADSVSSKDQMQRNPPSSDVKYNNKPTQEVPIIKTAGFKFTNHDQQLKYETALLDYELWRFKFVKKMHEHQEKETEKYACYIFTGLVVVYLLLIGSLISSFFLNFKQKTEKNENNIVTIEGFGFKAKLMINSILLVLVLLFSYLYYMYVTQMYQII
jgi:hypothetical protein